MRQYDNMGHRVLTDEEYEKYLLRRKRTKLILDNLNHHFEMFNDEVQYTLPTYSDMLLFGITPNRHRAITPEYVKEKMWEGRK